MAFCRSYCKLSVAVAVMVVTQVAFVRMAAGQGITAMIQGTVLDETKAALPGVTVTAVNTGTSAARTAVTDGRGVYRLVALPAGAYEVRAELAGFTPLVRRGVVLQVGQNAVLNLTLELGKAAEEIEVTAGAPIINLAEATTSGVVTDLQVRELPLNARDLLALVPLQPNALFADTGEQSVSRGLGTKVSIQGGRYNANSFTLDGTDIRDITQTAGGAAGILMGAESIQEFEVVTNAFSAIHGNHTGGVFNAITKSGTNRFRGSVFEFHRNSALDARNFFDREEKPDFRRNQFGGSIGGPILPDRLFFFGSYEGLRQNQPRTNTFIVPTAAARRGNLPAHPPLSLAPDMQAWLNVYPLPNGRDFGDGRAEFIRADEGPTEADYFTTGVDFNPGGRTSLFARYTDDRAERTSPALNINTVSKSKGQYLTLGSTQVFSPRLVGTFQVGATQTSLRTDTPVRDGVELPQLTFTDRRILDMVAVFSIGGLEGAGGSTVDPRIYDQDTTQVRGKLSYQMGRSTLTVGGEFTHYKMAHGDANSGAGNYSFRNLTEAVSGIVDQFQATVSEGIPWQVRQSYTGLYVQNDIQLRRNLTLNAGLRFEYVTVPSEISGRIANATKSFFEPGLTMDDFAPADPFFKNPSPSWLPRIGLAWDPLGDGKTSVRAGFGRYADSLLAGKWMFGLTSQPPFFVRVQIGRRDLPPGASLNFPDAFFTQQHLLADATSPEGFVQEPEQPMVDKWGVQVERELLGGSRVEIGYSGNRGRNLVRVLTAGVNNTWPLVRREDGRIYVPEGTGRLHPQLGRVRPRMTDGISDYHALNVGFVRPFSEGVEARVAYTLSKATGNSGVFAGSTDYSGQPNVGDHRAPVPPFMFMRLEEGLLPTDTRHNLSISARWEIPVGHSRAVQLPAGANALLGDWDLAAIARLSSGNPFSVDVAGGVYPVGRGNGLDLAPGADPNPIRPQNHEAYIDPSSFMLPLNDAGEFDPGLVGNLKRNTLIGPGVATVDVALAKSIRIAGSSELQLRVEVFNLLNRANFSNPEDANVFQQVGDEIQLNPTFGEIRSTRTTARQMQLGVRLVW